MFPTCFDDFLDFTAFEDVDEMGDGEVFTPPAGTAAQIVDSIDDRYAVFSYIHLNKVHLHQNKKTKKQKKKFTKRKLLFPYLTTSIVLVNSSGIMIFKKW